MPNTKSHLTRACFGVRDEGRERGTHFTPQTHPCGCVCGVQDEGKERKHVEHQKHTTYGVFLMFGVFGDRARQGEVSWIGERGRGVNSTFLMYIFSGCVLSHS